MQKMCAAVPLRREWPCPVDRHATEPREPPRVMSGVLGMRAAAAMFSAAAETVTMRLFFETKWSETVKNTP